MALLPWFELLAGLYLNNFLGQTIYLTKQIRQASRHTQIQKHTIRYLPLFDHLIQKSCRAYFSLPLFRSYQSVELNTTFKLFVSWPSNIPHIKFSTIFFHTYKNKKKVVDKFPQMCHTNTRGGGHCRSLLWTLTLHALVTGCLANVSVENEVTAV